MCSLGCGTVAITRRQSTLGLHVLAAAVAASALARTLALGAVEPCWHLDPSSCLLLPCPPSNWCGLLVPLPLPKGDARGSSRAKGKDLPLVAPISQSEDDTGGSPHCHGRCQSRPLDPQRWLSVAWNFDMRSWMRKWTVATSSVTCLRALPSIIMRSSMQAGKSTCSRLQWSLLGHGRGLVLVRTLAQKVVIMASSASSSKVLSC